MYTEVGASFEVCAVGEADDRSGIPRLVLPKIVFASVGQNDEGCRKRLGVVACLTLGAIGVNGETLGFDHGHRPGQCALKQSARPSAAASSVETWELSSM